MSRQHKEGGQSGMIGDGYLQANLLSLQEALQFQLLHHLIPAGKNTYLVSGITGETDDGDRS